MQPVWRNRGESVRQRFEFLLPHVSGQTVLDVGCAVGYRRSFWLHREISKASASCVGIDIDRSAIEEIHERFPELQVFQGDARSFDVGKQFDVVHAGELIEHIDNFQGFLASVKRHLNPNGKLVLSTPNADYYTHLLYNLTGGLRVNEEHVCWFCVRTIDQLLKRNGFEVEKIGYLQQPTYGLRKVFKWLSGILPERVRYPTLYVIAKPMP